ncbi:hypothetical protein SKAU_G00307660 [Synaphobranchus kaupii]|uniref:Uncharacterized protein n=1 Tax=Synaphobranchus kaupii TaxID=118154 RepID=A0A9Q1IKX6_SYNKA|nr:hypothetical protein SKAU_G00307660 [Synaphobranchus kaupii]
MLKACMSSFEHQGCQRLFERLFLTVPESPSVQLPAQRESFHLPGKPAVAWETADSDLSGSPAPGPSACWEQAARAWGLPGTVTGLAFGAEGEQSSSHPALMPRNVPE